jgi:hypothetical protein
MKCPICGGRAVGKVGFAQYYCWSCYLEYQYQDDVIKIFKVSEDGSLVEYDDTEIG